MKAYNLILREARHSVEPSLTLPQFDVMAQLSRRPEGVTFVDLSRSLLVSPGNLTGIVRRLEGEGLVAREAHESDRRAARLRLTAAGRRKMSALLPRHARDIARLFSPMPRGEVAQLRRLLGNLTHLLEPAPPAVTAVARKPGGGTP
jgi:DNA-binding MarR family transcriptional regulator